MKMRGRWATPCAAMLGAERSMDDLFIVCITHHFGDLAHNVQACVDTELIFALSEIMIEPNAMRIVLKDERRTDFMLRKTKNP